MRTSGLIALLGMSLMVVTVHAEPEKIVNAAYILPKTHFGELLEITAKIAGKTVVVPGEDVLKIQSSLVLPAPVSFADARKAIAALLMLEGYELVEAGDELHLRRVLTKEQVEAMNLALGRPLPGAMEQMPRKQAARGRNPRQWVVVRPDIAEKKSGEEAKKED